MIDRIGEFEAAGITNPTFLSQILALPSGIHKAHYPSHLWKWGALIIALFASLTTIVKRIKFLIIRLKNNSASIISSPSLFRDEFDYDSDSESESVSLASSSESEELEEEDDEEEEESTSFSQRWRFMDEDCSVGGTSSSFTGHQWQNGNLRLRRSRNGSIGDLFSWSDFTTGKNTVVKLWDNLALGLGTKIKNDIDPRDEVSVYDANLAQNIYSIIGEKYRSGIKAVSTSSSPPAVIVSAETNPSGSFMRVFDTRGGCRMPDILAEWRPRLERIVGVNMGGGGGSGAVMEKVFVRDDVTGGLKVGDIRKAGSPLVEVTEADVETWWDADAVMVAEDFVVD